MNPIELKRALKQLRLGGIAAVLETRLHQAQTERMAPIDLISCLVSDELSRRSDRLLERRKKEAEFRDPQVSLDNFDFNFNKKMNRSLVFDLATANFIAKHEDALFLGPPGTGKSHLAQAIGQASIQQGYRVLYRETHTLINDIADAALDGTRKEQMELFSTVPLLLIDDLGMRKLPIDCRRRSTRDRHASLRTREHAVDFKQTHRRLGQTAGRYRGSDSHARPASSSRSRSQIRSSQLANENAVTGR